MQATIAAAIASLQVVLFSKNNIVILVIIKMNALYKIIINAFHFCVLK
jgi:hypothetical protein